MSQDVVTAGHGASDVIFTSDTDPFGGYFSGWQTLLVLTVFLILTVALVRRNGPLAGRVTFFLGLVALGVTQIAPYLLMLPQMRQYGVTFVSQLPQWLTQMAFVEAFWLPAIWLTAMHGKLTQKVLVALCIAVVTALPLPLYYLLAPYGNGLGSIGYQVIPAGILSGVLFTLHLLFIALSPMVSGTKTRSPNITPA